MKKIFRVICFCIMAVLAAYGFAKFTRAAIINSTIDSSTIGATTPSSAVVTQLGVNTGLTQTGTGIKHFRGTSCTTPTGAGNTCNTTVTWPGGAFADTNYTYVCFTNGDGFAALNSGTAASKAAGSIVVVMQNTPGNTGAVSEGINCIAFHD